jgi:hypothetical protein
MKNSKILLVVACLALAAPFAQAISFDFTSDHVTNGAGTAPFGTVTLTQNGTTVDFNVVLAAGYSFVKTGSGDDQAFKFNATGVVLGDITIDAHTPALVAATGTFNGDGTGDFGFGINAPTQGPGGSDPFTAPIVFHVANSLISDFTNPNNQGQLFVADILAPNGNTGPVDASTPNSVPDGGTTLMLLGSSFAGLGLLRRYFRR